MACMKLGSKADVLYLDGQSWHCSSGLPSDVCIEVGEMFFHLHKFPLLSRSQLLEKLIQDSASEKSEEAVQCVISLQDLPGGADSFLLIAKFCYGVKTEITPMNVVSLRCAAEYLQMNEEYGEGNLIPLTVAILDEVLGNWADTIKALETCEAVLPLSEELHIISRCIDSLATKACADPTLFRWPRSGQVSAESPPWNGIHSTSEPSSPIEDWWYEDVSCLKLPLFKRLILAVGSKGMALNRISGAVIFYAKRYLPLSGRKVIRQKKLATLSDAEQRTLIEEIVELLPNHKGATPTSFLFRLLKTSMILRASPSCRETLERRIGAQLELAVLKDLLIPNTGDSDETTLYDVECVQRIVDHFLYVDHDDADSSLHCAAEADELDELAGSHSLSSTTVVANLLDDYLVEVASDSNLTLEKFVLLASAIPNYARPLDDGIYRAIDIYLKAHPQLTDYEREQICRLMNCQKLSIEASTHAAENERLPLRVIIQVLFFEQLRLRTYVAGCFFASDSLEQSQNLSGNMGQRNKRAITVKSKEGEVIKFDEMKERVNELEKECDEMKHEIEKLEKTKKSWIINLYKMFGLKVKTKSFDLKSAMADCNGEALQPSRKADLGRKKGHHCKLAD